MEVSLLPHIIIGLAVIGAVIAGYFVYYIHFIRGVKPIQTEGSYYCPRCRRRIVEITLNCPECNKKLLFREERP
jgi:DNA-directed RNA polymerase subunit RPC12/RpoP